MPHTLAIETAALPASPTGSLVIYAAEGEAPAGAGAAIWTATGLDWAKVTASRGFHRASRAICSTSWRLRASRPSVCWSSAPASSGGGRRHGLAAFTDRGGSLFAKLGKAESAAVLLDGPELVPAAIAEIAAGLRLRHYRFDKYKSPKAGDDNNEPAARTVTLYVNDESAVDAAIADRMPVAEGQVLARDLINEPANVLGPVEFAAEIEKLRDLGVEVEILLPKEMQKLGMNSLLCVAWGSRLRQPGSASPTSCAGVAARPDSRGAARLRRQGRLLRYRRHFDQARSRHGGHEGRHGRRRSRHRPATRRSQRLASAKVNAVGVIGLVENMPDGNAVRPGDIIKAMSGTTIEINNTDAEGRLVLADAIWYTQDRFKPVAMVDLATLTGAIIIALGHDHAGLFSNNDELAGKLLAAGLASGEKLWRMPLGPAYDKQIESRFADIKQTAGRPGGAIIAAQFLQRFVNNVPWAHLDIAATAFGTSNTETNTSWGVGFGVTLLDRLVRDNYEG